MLPRAPPPGRPLPRSSRRPQLRFSRVSARARWWTPGIAGAALPLPDTYLHITCVRTLHARTLLHSHNPPAYLIGTPGASGHFPSPSARHQPRRARRSAQSLPRSTDACAPQLPAATSGAGRSSVYARPSLEGPALTRAVPAAADSRILLLSALCLPAQRHVLSSHSPDPLRLRCSKKRTFYLL
ncbi:hypothetical protein BDZ91DRAFT_734022 [Kalaharituber pfeilii]|nr:hypothetical protein BDZ91DRAFT_734022 [Kalaharituber pfeilii]